MHTYIYMHNTHADITKNKAMASKHVVSIGEVDTVELGSPFVPYYPPWSSEYDHFLVFA